MGCHDLLERWGAAPSLCRAGAFHSVYGTATFEAVTVDSAERPWVREVIGPEAEQLVFLFCFGDRRRLMADNDGPPYTWTDHRTGATLELDEETFRNLVVLEVANFVEQLPHIDAVPDTVIADMAARIAAQDRWLEPVMRADLQATLARRHRREAER